MTSIMPTKHDSHKRYFSPYLRACLSAFVATCSLGMPLASFAQPKMAWRSTDWISPRFSSLYESDEIREDSKGVFRIDQKFEREVGPNGPVSPQAVNFWRACVVSRFASKEGFAGWAMVDGPNTNWNPPATTFYFMLANTATELAEVQRKNFQAISGFERMCGEFLKPEYHWWK
jgi:hypothetical protein